MKVMRITLCALFATLALVACGHHHPHLVVRAPDTAASQFAGDELVNEAATKDDSVANVDLIGGETTDDLFSGDLFDLYFPKES